jgi:hypothetical protein
VSFDIHNVADAVLVIADRWESGRHDVERICGDYNLQAAGLFKVMRHLNWRNVDAQDAMVTGILVGLALARGDAPCEDALRAEWVSWRTLRDAVLAECAPANGRARH